MPLQPTKLNFNQKIFPSPSHHRPPSQGLPLLPNPPNEINQTQVSHVERDVRLVTCNSSCKIDLKRYFDNLPEAEILAANEIGRPKAFFEEAARRAQ